MMKMHLRCTLYLVGLLHAQALIAPTPSQKLSLKYHVTTRHSLVVRCSMAVEKTEWKTLQEFNIELDRLAELSGKDNQPVITRAAECQTAWEDRLRDSTTSIKPDTVSFNTVLKAWTKCCQALVAIDRSQRHRPLDTGHSVPVYTPRDAAERATTLLLKQIEADVEGARPDTTSFNVVIDAWAKSRVDDAPQAAERLLKLMISREDIEPDALSYHGVLDAWAHSNSEESTTRVNQIFQHMESLYVAGKDIKPTIRTVNLMVHAHARAANHFTSHQKHFDQERALQCAEDAYDLLKDMNKRYEETQDPDFAPDVLTYTSVMDVFARCGSYKASKQAESLLEELKHQYNKSHNPRLRPNVRTYTSLVSAWSRTRSSESPMKVEALLKEMSDNPATRPNSRTYTSVILCWAKSNDGNKAKKALKVLRDMKELYKVTGDEDVRPTVLSYNAAITACANCRGTMEQQTEALKIAFAVLKAIELDETVKPNSVTYTTLLKAVGALLPAGAERNHVGQALFEKAKTAGLVDPLAVRHLKKAVDATVLLELFDGVPERNGMYDLNSMPAAWSKNVK